MSNSNDDLTGTLMTYAVVTLLFGIGAMIALASIVDVSAAIYAEVKRMPLFYVPLLVFGGALAVKGFVHYRFVFVPARASREALARQEQTERDRKQAEEELKAARQRLALTCEKRKGGCGRIGFPVFDTYNRYLCPDCNRRFIGPPHGL